MTLRLGVLEPCRVAPDDSGANVLVNTVEIAEAADELGYSRMWLSEHHEATVAHGAPAILATLLAGSTQRIRVGTAGVLLRLYPAIEVAKSFRLLSTFFPGRIDLGIGAGVPPPELFARSQCREQLAQLAACYETDEIIFVDLCRLHEDRLRSLTQLAEACALIAPR